MAFYWTILTRVRPTVFKVIISVGLNLRPVSSGSSLSDKVHQTPAAVHHKPGEAAEINCSHSIDSYDRIYWYRRFNDRQLHFLGYLNIIYGYPEPGLNVKMTGDANKNKTATLSVLDLTPNISAVYFCAASLHTATDHTTTEPKPHHHIMVFFHKVAHDFKSDLYAKREKGPMTNVVTTPTQLSFNELRVFCQKRGRNYEL